MTISVSEQAWAEWEEERSPLIEYPDPDDECDVLLPHPTWLGQGDMREITLREGLIVQIDNCQLRDRLQQTWAEDENWIHFHCHLSGDHQESHTGHQESFTEVGSLEFALYGNGVIPRRTFTCSGQLPMVEVMVTMSPEVLMNFAGNQKVLPSELQHLIGASSQMAYARTGVLSLMMQGVLRQIMHCP